MGFTKRYDRTGSSDTAQREAINDLVSFIGLRRSKILMRHARNAPNTELSRDIFAGYCSFAGVRGYPVDALWEYCHK